MGVDRLRWYAHRLTSMSAAEVRWRAGRVVAGVGEPLADRRARGTLPSDDATWGKWLEAFRQAQGRPVLLDPDRGADVVSRHPEQAAEVVRLAEGLLAGRLQLFGLPEVALADPPDWHHDLLSDHHWARGASRRIDHRTAPADPKWIWELNRLQHLPWLAQAHLFTGREEFAACAFTHLDSWIAQNPPGDGLAWRGAFEAGVRAISVLVALQGLRHSRLLTVPRFRAVVEMLEASGRRCWSERSRFSSANNHLVGELAGLATIGLLLPELPRSASWVRDAVRELAIQAELQVLPDGAGAEQSVTYQMFVAEFLLLVRVLCRDEDLPGAETLSAAVRRSTVFLRDLVHEGEPSPRYGDDDQSFVLRLGPEPVRTVADHLALVTACGGEAPPRGVSAAWWAHGAAGMPAIVGAESRRDSFHASAGGLVVMRSGGQRVTVDVGPLGYLSLAAHGHADALAVTLAMDGRAIVDDPGTGSYYAHPSWRRSNRSTRAHGTVSVDDLDQSVMAGPFMWSRHARSRVRLVDMASGVVEADHDGYERLAQPVTHRRRVEVDPHTDGFVVLDVVQGRGRHDVRVSWPLAPDLQARTLGDGHLVLDAGVPVLQVCTVATVALIHESVYGDEKFDLGWWSDRLESRRPAYWLSSRAQGEVPLVLVSVVRRVSADGLPAVRDLQVALDRGLAIARWSEHGRPAVASVSIPVSGGS